MKKKLGWGRWSGGFGSGRGLAGSGVWVGVGVVWGIGDLNQELKALLTVHKGSVLINNLGVEGGG